MSLARRLMNGGIDGCTATVNESRYSADNGAMMIAMESAAELYEIAQEFYNYEQADISAIVEGVALEGSQYEPVAEAALKNAFDKVKAFIQKLWAKVKAFFKNVLVFLDAVFKSGKDFVKKYKDQISKLKDVEIETNMWEYDDDAIDKEIDVAAVTDTKEFTDAFKNILSEDKDTKEIEAYNASRNTNGIDGDIEKIEKQIDTGIISDATDGAAETMEDANKYFYNLYRGNKSTANLDKPKRTLKESDVKDFASTLESSKGIETIKKAQSKVDTEFKKAINQVNKYESQIKNSEKTEKNNDFSKGYSKYAKLASLTSKAISKLSNVTTAKINAKKAAMKERDAAYKMVISKAISKGNYKAADK